MLRILTSFLYRLVKGSTCWDMPATAVSNDCTLTGVLSSWTPSFLILLHQSQDWHYLLPPQSLPVHHQYCAGFHHYILDDPYHWSIREYLWSPAFFLEASFSGLSNTSSIFLYPSPKLSFVWCYLVSLRCFHFFNNSFRSFFINVHLPSK